jgi:hypothetical protein
MSADLDARLRAIDAAITELRTLRWSDVERVKVIEQSIADLSFEFKNRNEQLNGLWRELHEFKKVKLAPVPPPDPGSAPITRRDVAVVSATVAAVGAIVAGLFKLGQSVLAMFQQRGN